MYGGKGWSFIDQRLGNSAGSRWCFLKIKHRVNVAFYCENQLSYNDGLEKESEN